MTDGLAATSLSSVSTLQWHGRRSSQAPRVHRPLPTETMLVPAALPMSVWQIW